MNKQLRNTAELLENDRLQFVDYQPASHDAAQELLDGLEAPSPSISPKFFYDEHGAALFTSITKLPEYYPTRIEMAILTEHSAEIAGFVGESATIIEPGSGNSEKIRLLLDRCRPDNYVPIDISMSQLQGTADQLVSEFSWLRVYAVCADFNDDLRLPDELLQGRRVAFYPGSTLGNLEPHDAERFLARLLKLVGTDGGLLVGIDLQKDLTVLNAAYNDSDGITAAFNRNALVHANRVLDADFDISAFDHQAAYDVENACMVMHLISLREQTVRHRFGQLHFAAGQRIHTENSYKYTLTSFETLAGRAGLKSRCHWTDSNDWFALYYLEAAA